MKCEQSSTESNNNSPKKRCTKCKEEKPLTEFCKSQATNDGLQYNCKNCFILYMNEKYQDPEFYELQKMRNSLTRGNSIGAMKNTLVVVINLSLIG
jgi:hypothetical protein